MPKWTDYTIKTDPADKDEVMILDAAGKANKRLGLSVLSDWIIGKIANKVFENLQTQNKTILGALNELNSKSLPKIKFIDGGEFSASDANSAEQAAKLVFDEKVPVSEGIIIFADFIFSYHYSMIIQKYARGDYGAFILFGCNVQSLSYHVKVKGVWK